jgi:hypothetical protein
MMRKLVICFSMLFLILTLSGSYAAEGSKKVVLLIAEQNIEGPQRAWWASEIDLSASEAILAQKLIEAGFEIVEPSSVTKIIDQEKAFRRVDLSEGESVKLANLAKAEYVLSGKALASSGSKVPQSNMVSCFANITAKLIRVKDGSVISYVDASGSSAHMDAVTGGKEALADAAADLAGKIVEALSKEGGK